ncbi:hypothetical protein PTKIN_Ptkin14bG0182500 [Pterospermum kingtungense]
MDRFTANRERVAYVKVCVEIDVSTPISKKLSVVLEDGVKVLVYVETLWLPSKCSTCCVFGHSIKNCPKKKDSAGGNANVQGKAGSVARFFVLANEVDDIISISKPSTVIDLMNDIKAKSCSIMGSLSIDKSKGVILEGEVMDEANETISDTDSEANLEKSNGRPKLPIVGLVRPQRLASLGGY